MLTEIFYFEYVDGEINKINMLKTNLMMIGLTIQSSLIINSILTANIYGILILGFMIAYIKFITTNVLVLWWDKKIIMSNMKNADVLQSYFIGNLIRMITEIFLMLITLYYTNNDVVPNYLSIVLAIIFSMYYYVVMCIRISEIIHFEDLNTIE